MCVVSLTPKALLTQNARRRNVLTRVDACFKAAQSVRIWVIMCIGLLLDARKRTIPVSVLNNQTNLISTRCYAS